MANKGSKEMPFLAHLEELRWHLVRSFVAIFIVAIVIFLFKETVYNHFLLAHRSSNFVTYRGICQFFALFGSESAFCTISFNDKLQVLKVTQQFMNAIWVSLILGFIFSFPYVLWEIWRFVAPGLHENEIKKSRGFIFTASLLFFIGVLFSYYVILPMSVFFFYTFQITDLVENQITLQSHISLVTNTMLGVAIMFELPVIIYFLSKIGLVTPEFLKKYRRHAITLVVILAAIITPPDVASQIIVAIPILILYEISIKVSKRVIKNQAKKDAQQSN